MVRKKEIMHPLATAIWLIDNTSLTFEQIAEFCGFYLTEIQSIADGLIGKDTIPVNPIANGTLTKEEIERCEKNSKQRLKDMFSLLRGVQIKITKKKKYTPMSQRRNRPEAVLWLVNFAPDLIDSQIIRLVRTTKSMIESIKSKSYKNYMNLVAKDPVLIGFCTQRDLNSEIEKAKKKKDS